MESIKKIDKFNIYLISILPFALAAGPAVIETVSAIIISLFFISKNKIKFCKIDKLIFAIYLCLITTSLLSNFVVDSCYHQYSVRFILLYLIIKYYFFTEYKFKIINLTFLVLCITF